jgi:hypothetical protein
MCDDFIKNLLEVIAVYKSQSFSTGNIHDILFLRQLEIDLNEELNYDVRKETASKSIDLVVE